MAEASLDQRGTVAVLTLRREDRRNALDQATLEQLRASVAEAGSAGTRALVLTGAGTHFCAGADLSTVEDAGFVDLLRSVLVALHEAPFVTIAAIHGAAMGAGVQLAAACDLRVAAPDATFGVPAGRLGLTVDLWTVARVVALAGDAAARGLLVGGEQLSGVDAHRLGLVHRLGSLDDAVAWAAEVAQLAPLTVQAHKLMLNRVTPAPAGDDEVASVRRRAWESSDLHEGLAAFRERRPPVFRGG